MQNPPGLSRTRQPAGQAPCSAQTLCGSISFRLKFKVLIKAMRPYVTCSPHLPNPYLKLQPLWTTWLPSLPDFSRTHHHLTHQHCLDVLSILTCQDASPQTGSFVSPTCCCIPRAYSRVTCGALLGDVCREGGRLAGRREVRKTEQAGPGWSHGGAGLGEHHLAESSRQPPELYKIIRPLQMWKQRLRDVGSLAQGHMASKQEHEV